MEGVNRDKGHTMMRTPTIGIARRGDRVLWRVYCGTDMNGKPIRHYRASKAEAEELARKLSKTIRRIGTAAGELTAAQTYDAAEAYRLLEEAHVDMGLAECVRQWLAQSRDVLSVSTMPLKDALRQYLERLPKTSEHHRTVGRMLGEFITAFGDARPMRDICKADVERFLAPVGAPKSHNLKRGYILAFLNWGRKQGHYPAGMYERVTGIEKRAVPYRPPVFFRSGTVASVMAWAERQDDAAMIVPRFALGFFAGIRTAEVERMVWGNVNFGDMTIRVETPKGETGTMPRLVSMSANLAEWLMPYAGEPDEPAGYDKNRLTAAKRRLDAELGNVGFTRPENRNVMRHTFATMHAAYHRNFELTAAEMGHGTSTAMLRRHYQSITTRADAEAFWNICPARSAAVLTADGA